MELHVTWSVLRLTVSSSEGCSPCIPEERQKSGQWDSRLSRVLLCTSEGRNGVGLPHSSLQRFHAEKTQMAKALWSSFPRRDRAADDIDSLVQCSDNVKTVAGLWLWWTSRNNSRTTVTWNFLLHLRSLPLGLRIGEHLVFFYIEERELMLICLSDNSLMWITNA